jgi:serine/threonine protein kinase
VAVKRIDWSTNEQRSSVAKRIATEISVLQSLQHPLLPTLHQVYTTGNEICLEMTLCSRGTLWHERQALGGKLPVDLVRQYAAELVCVLNHLHDNGVIYVDLKPENVLLQDCGHIMLCDMDLAYTMSEVEMLRQMATAAGDSAAGPGFWGTLEYAAPEVALHGTAAYSPASDWWGLGVLMYELLLGLVPWDGDGSDAMLEQIKQADVLWPPEGILDREAEDLIRGLLVLDPAQRLGSGSVREIMQHPFFASIGWSRMELEVKRDQQLYAEMAAKQQQQEMRQQQMDLAVAVASHR